MTDFSNRRELLLKIFLVLSFLLILLFLLWPKPTDGYGQTEEVGRLSSEIKINDNGSADIIQEISFSAGSSYLYWVVPYSEIDSLEIREEGKILFPTEVRKESERTIIFWQSLAKDSFYQRSVSISYHLPSQVDLHRDRQISQTVVWRELGMNIDQAEVTVLFPSQIRDVRQRFYAIHGINQAKLTSSHEGFFKYHLKGLSPYAIFSVSLSFPEGSLKIPFSQRIRIFLASLSLETVLLISLLIPLIVYLFLFSLYRNHVYTKDLNKVSGSFDHPPDDLNPPLVEMLAQNRLTERGIGALIFQLLGRGYLTIIDREEGITIGKIKEPDEKLNKMEDLIIRILFRQRELKGGLSELKRKKSQQLFDQLTDQLYSRIDYLVNREHYFVGDTTQVKNKILRQGMAIFFLAIILAVLFLFFIPSSPWLALTPISLVVASLMIVRMRSVFTVRTPKGQQELIKWLKYKNFLAQDHPLPGAHRKNFEEALPWAFLFRVTDQWLGKFIRYPIVKPKWFVSSHYGLTAEDWVKRSCRLVDELAQEIVGLKSPG